jgi:hypothetical protein
MQQVALAASSSTAFLPVTLQLVVLLPAGKADTGLVTHYSRYLQATTLQRLINCKQPSAQHMLSTADHVWTGRGGGLYAVLKTAQAPCISGGDGDTRLAVICLHEQFAVFLALCRSGECHRCAAGSWPVQQCAECSCS